MSNVKARRKSRISPFRKIAIGTWQTAYDPSIYGSMRLRMDPVLAYIEKFREKTGQKLTVTHLVIKAVAQALKECPDANAILRWNWPWLREDIDISVLVVMESDGHVDLSAAKLEKVDNLTLSEIIEHLENHVSRIRAGKDKELEQTRQSMRFVPAMLMNFLLKFLTFVGYTMNWNLSRLGIPRDPFGGAIVTSIGSLGLDTGYVPLVPYSKVPIFVAPGAVTEEPVVENGKVVPGHMIGLHATFDHRVIDGAHASQLAGTIRRMFETPFESFGEVE